jgi:hypothetical protein
VEPDPLLRRIGRTALVVCGVMTLLALVVSRSPLMSALAVIGGGVIAGVSYRAIQAGVTALVDGLAGTPTVSQSRPAVRWVVIRLTTRYALLGFAAYVMIARLRLPPFGLLAGASSIVTAVAVEAVRFLIKKDLASRT